MYDIDERREGGMLAHELSPVIHTWSVRYQPRRVHSSRSTLRVKDLLNAMHVSGELFENKNKLSPEIIVDDVLNDRSVRGGTNALVLKNCPANFFVR